MACLWKHPLSKYWFARFADATGRRVNRSTKKTKRSEARLVADAWERAARNARTGTLTRARATEIINELLIASGAEPVRTITTEGLFETWLATVRSGDASEQTLNRYRTVTKHFKTHLGESRCKALLSTVTTADVQGYVNERLKSREGKTVLNDFRAISAAMSFAVRMNFIERNPCSGVEIRTKETLKRRPFTEAEIDLLIAAAPSDEWRLLLTVLWYTALRIGDASQLQWANIDLSSGHLTLEQTKTGTLLRQSIGDELRQYLEDFAGDHPGPVFPELSKYRPGGKNGLSAQFAAIVRAAGISEDRIETKSGRSFARLSAHSMRHGVATALAKKGVPPDQRQQVTGHSDSKTLAVYTHHDDDAMRGVMAEIPRLKRWKAAPPKQ